jgi:hypothetical protein
MWDRRFQSTDEEQKQEKKQEEQSKKVVVVISTPTPPVAMQQSVVEEAIEETEELPNGLVELQESVVLQPEPVIEVVASVAESKSKRKGKKKIVEETPI